jgi:fructose-bisphosphate aldolase class I
MENMSSSELEGVAKAMVAKDKGLLAADESNSTIAKRLAKIGTESTEEQRRTYRELLFTAPGIAQWISGVILYDETIRQKTRDGVPFPDYLTKLGIIPGIKVDTGAKPLAGFAGETITEGLDGLRERLIEYYKLGARFAKWRAVIDIGEGIPTRFAIEANAHALARYAALCQEQNIVPIVEPEVLMDGGHTQERCDAVTSEVQAEVFAQLERHRVHLEGMILKPNMVISGKKCPTRATPEQVAAATVSCLKRHAPAAVPGIMFLSGGQTPAEAALHLSLMNRLGPLPWQLSFSYGRALQDAALTAWGGKPGNFAAGQKEFQKWSRLNGLARSGGFQAGMEQQAA